MKRFAKFMSLVIVIAMMTMLAIPALAEEPKGTITINNAIPGTTYNAYKIMELTYDGHGTETTADDAYMYYMPAESNPWHTFLERSVNKYITITLMGDKEIITWISNADINAFAREAKSYAETNKVPATRTVEGEKVTSTVVTIPDVGMGYYLVDSTTGALVSLNTATPNVTINEKNEVPTIEKKVLEQGELAADSDDEWVDLNRVESGDTIFYKITIHPKAGAQNYVLYDKMDTAHIHFLEDGAVFQNDTKVTAGENTYTLKLATEEEKEVFSFKIEFAKAFLDDLKSDDVITVTYSALFIGTPDAVLSSPHSNTAWLEYGAEGGKHQTVADVVNTISYGLQVLKYGDGLISRPLGGATFELYRSCDETNGALSDPVYVHLESEEDNKNTVYTVCNKVPTQEEPHERLTTMITPKGTGEFILYGLDMETYYLKEVQAPSGYNPLSAPVAVTIDVEHLSGRVYDVNINNNSGTILPDTGGIGTTVFYILGGALVVGAAVLLITKKRMGTEV